MCLDAQLPENQIAKKVLGELELDPIGMYDPRDGGIGYLRNLMDNLSPEEIAKQDLSWATEKYQALCDSLNSGLFSKKMSSDTRGVNLLVKYSLSLEDILTRNNIKFTVLGGIHQ